MRELSLDYSRSLEVMKRKARPVPSEATKPDVERAGPYAREFTGGRNQADGKRATPGFALVGDVLARKAVQKLNWIRQRAFVSDS
jgi:hypothetical protein